MEESKSSEGNRLKDSLVRDGIGLVVKEEGGGTKEIVRKCGRLDENLKKKNPYLSVRSRNRRS